MDDLPYKVEPQDSLCALLGGASSRRSSWVGGVAIFKAQHRLKGSEEAETLRMGARGALAI